MTWKEFKDKVEAEGVKDADELWYIDTCGSDDFECKPDSSMGWKIA